MRRIASLALAIAGLTVTALPGLADDQSTGRPYSAVQRAAPSWYGAYDAPYDDSAQGGGFVQRSCTYSGGPKASTTWTCQ
jgi:hypothetical protein